MGKKVVLVGHCGADMSYLKSAVRSADREVEISSAGSEAELKSALASGADLVLVNRVVDYGFESEEGVKIVQAFIKAFPGAKMMLVTNYPEVQKAALQAGALPGFGKREIGTAKVKEILQKALGSTVTTAG